jgi:SNW domain-containing protein 1
MTVQSRQQQQLILHNNGNTQIGHSTSSKLAVQVKKDGTVDFNALITPNMSQQQADLLQSSLSDMQPMRQQLKEDDISLMRPSAEEEAKVAERTKKALGLIVDEKMALAKPTHLKQQNKEITYVRYTPASQSAQNALASTNAQIGSQRIIRLQEAAVDPLAPPQFKHRRLPAAPAEQDVPIMHSPTRKVTREQQEEWRIPAVISNWKNIKGYVIPLDKRMASDGRSLIDHSVNDRFASFAESLMIAERSARDEIMYRAELKKKLAHIDAEQQENELRKAAQEARQSLNQHQQQYKQQHDENDARHERQPDDDDERQNGNATHADTKSPELDASALEAMRARDELRRQREADYKRQLQQSRAQHI